MRSWLFGVVTLVLVGLMFGNASPVRAGAACAGTVAASCAGVASSSCAGQASNGKLFKTPVRSWFKGRQELRAKRATSCSGS